MVKSIKIALFAALFALQSYAASSFELAQNLIANPSAESKLRLLFEGKNYVDESGRVRWDEITRVLKMNSLLSLTLPNSRTLQLSFKAKSDEVVFLKIINEALNQAGFVLFTPVEVNLQDDVKKYTIRVESRYILDPASFYAILRQNAVYINSIRKMNAYDYEYELDFSSARLKPNVEANLYSSVKLQRPLRDYVINIQGASTLNARASSSDSWFPKVLFLDKNLHLLKSTISKNKQNRFSSAVPSGAAYVIIGDAYNLDNIRRGLEIQLSK